jgi:hypothetical protein
MSVVRIFQPQNPLTEIIGGLEDPTTASLTRDAETRVLALRDQIRAYVVQQHAILSGYTAGPEETIFANCREIGHAARAISDVAGAADMEVIGEAARGIFALVNALACKGVWHTDALKLHVDALALFISDAPPNRCDAAQMLARLKSMRDWVGVPE